ncbi:hypothetical protein ACHAXT_011066 [Thalassiosira profunda]
MSPPPRSNDLLADAMNYLSYLLGLIESQDWDRFEDFALKNPNTFRFISKSIQECEEFNGMSLLHACVRYNPPLKLLERMIQLYPRALRGEDCLGRTPLHVAAGTGASPWVIKLLVLNYSEACNIQDLDGRTPLHFACDTSCELFEDDADCLPRGPPALNTVRFLLAGSLDAVTLEDVDEMNAVEYAIISDAPMEVVNLLQRATQRVMKTNSRRSSLKSASDSEDESPSMSPTSSMARIRVN